MATINVLDAAGATVAIEKPLAPGSAAAALSRPVALSTEDAARQGIVTETAPATDTASSGLNGRLQRIAQRITSMIALLPAALGAGGGLKVDGSGTALPVSGTVTANAGTGNHAVTAAAGAIVDGANATVGTKADAKSVATDATPITAISIWKQISASVQALVAALAPAGTSYETVAASQAAQTLGGTGAVGDYLSHVMVQPTSTTVGVVTILDNATQVHAYPGGTVGADLVPFPIMVGAKSVSGAWKITTGAGVKVTGYGTFT